jgi:RNA polymerase sigma-70 factor (sigma-E family)
MEQDPPGFADFYASAKDDCLRTVLAITGDLQEAEDLVAEAFARAWAAWHRVRRHPVPRAWVIRTALNTRVSWWRRRRGEVVSGEINVPAAGSGPAADAGRVDDGLLAALRRLPVRQRQVVALRFLLDLDVAQTARALGLAEGTVRAHTARAIAALREESGLAAEEEPA